MDPSRLLLNQVHNGNREEDNLALIQLKILLEGDLRRYLNFRFYQQGEDFIDELEHHTWLKVWLYARQCQGDSRESILKWIKTIAYRTGLNMMRDGDALQEYIHFGDTHPDENNDCVCDQLDAGQGLWDNQQTSLRPVEKRVIFQEKVQNLINKLSPQEHKVFIYCAYGYSKSEVAAMLNISKPRVSQYIEQINKKNRRPGK